MKVKLTLILIFSVLLIFALFFYFYLNSALSSITFMPEYFNKDKAVEDNTDIGIVADLQTLPEENILEEEIDFLEEQIKLF